jgi:hypothetical protein
MTSRLGTGKTITFFTVFFSQGPHPSPPLLTVKLLDILYMFGDRVREKHCSKLQLNY